MQRILILLSLVVALIAAPSAYAVQPDEIMSDPANLDALLARGAERARPLASQTLRLVKEKVGLI